MINRSRSISFLVLMLLLLVGRIAAAQTTRPADPTEFEEQTDRFWHDSRQLYEDGKLVEAIASGHQALDAAMQRSGVQAVADQSRLCIWVANLSAEHGDDAAALQLLDQLDAVWNHQHGPGFDETGIRLHIKSDLLRQALKMSAADRAEMLRSERLSRRVEDLAGRNRYADTIPRALEILKIRRTILGDRDVSTGAVQVFLAVSYDSLGDLDSAERMCRLAVGVYDAALGPDNPLSRQARWALADVLNERSAELGAVEEPGRAVPFLKERVDLLTQAKGPDDPLTRDAAAVLQAMTELATWDHARYRVYTRSAALLGRAVELDAQGRLDEAIAAAEEAMQYRRASVGESSFLVLKVLPTLVSLYDEKGQPQRGDELIHHFMDVSIQTNGPDSLTTCAIRIIQLRHAVRQHGFATFADLPKELSQYEELLHLYQKLGSVAEVRAARTAMSQLERLLALPPDKVQRFLDGRQLAARSLSLKDQNRIAEAIKDWRAAVDIIIEIFGAEDRTTLPGGLAQLSDLYAAKGDMRKAAEYSRRCLDLMEMDAQGPDADLVGMRRVGGSLGTRLEAVANDYFRRGQYAESLAAQQQALVAYRHAFGGNDPRVANARATLKYVRDVSLLLPEKLRERQKAIDDATRADQLFQQGKYAEALPTIEEALRVWGILFGEDNTFHAKWLLQLADIDRYLKKSPAEVEACTRAAGIYHRLLGDDDARSRAAWQRLSDALTRPHALGKTLTPAEQLATERSLEAVETALQGEQSSQAIDHRNAAAALERGMRLSRSQAQTLHEMLVWRDQADVLAAGGRREEAIAMELKYIEAADQLTGPSLLRVNRLNLVAAWYRELGREADAEKTELKAIEQARQCVGERHPAYIRARAQHLAASFQACKSTNRALARQLLEEKVLLYRRRLGDNNALVREADWDLEEFNLRASLSPALRDDLEEGERLMASAEHSESKHRFADALDARKKAVVLLLRVYRDDHPRYADALVRLAATYVQELEPASALPVLRDAARIYTISLGANAGSLTDVQVTLSRVEAELGDFDRAKQFANQAFQSAQAAGSNSEFSPASSSFVVRLFRSGVNKMHTEVAGLQKLLKKTSANRQQLATRWAAAADDLDAELAQLMSGFSGEMRTSPELQGDGVDGLAMLAELRALMGQYDQAIAKTLAVRDVARKMLGTGAARVGQLTLAVARIEIEAGQLDKAVQYASEATTFFKAFPDAARRPELAESLTLLATIQAAQKHPADALQTLVSAMNAEQTVLDAVLNAATERGMMKYLGTVSGSLDTLLRMTLDTHESTGPGVEQALTWTLRRKAVVLNALFRRRATETLAARRPEAAQQLGRLHELRLLIAKPPFATNTDAGRESLGKLSDEADQLEATLASQLADATNTPAIEVPAVRRALRGSVLVEYVRLRDSVANTAAGQPMEKARYVAFVLPADPAAPVQMIDLHDAAAIDAAVKKVRDAIKGFDPDNSDEKTKEGEYRSLARDLYRLAFKPLLPALGPARQIYIAPDGNLNLVSFDALVDEDGKYLIQGDYRFVYESSGQDLLRPKWPAGDGTFVFANPDYQLSASDRNRLDQAAVAALPPINRTLLRGSHPADAPSRHHDRLPATTREAASVKQLLQESIYGPVQLLMDKQALRSTLLALHSPRVLHLATHGYYDPPPEGPNTDFAVSNPLLRCGIVLAGASADDSNGDDGLVSAEEIAGMDLRGTELVVLSACETGLGDIRDGEGVYGLRRAFLNAGAQTLLISLFKVPDEQTQQLMASFYQSLSMARPKLQSLHDAQLQLLDQRMKQHGAAHPFYWASFVLVGDPR